MADDDGLTLDATTPEGPAELRLAQPEPLTSLEEQVAGGGHGAQGTTAYR